jgi:hypothetical protein
MKVGNGKPGQGIVLFRSWIGNGKERVEMVV